MTVFFASLRTWRQSYDWLAIIYILVTGVLPLFNPDCFQQVAKPGPLHAPWPHLAWHAVLAAAVFILPPLLRRQQRWPLRLLGVIYLPLILPVFYAELEFLGVLFFPYGQSFDPQLIALEGRIFGFQPSLQWSRVWPWPWLLELMQFAYFSYYFFGFIALLLVWTTGKRTAARNWALSAVLTRDLTAVMLSCYVWFIVFPVWGPKYFDFLGIAGPVASEGLQGGFFNRIMIWLHANGALHGAAFPSSHVAGSLVSWWWGWRLAPRHRWWLTTLWGLLGLSIVYCRYHYVIDLVAGIAWGALVLSLAHCFLPQPAVGLQRQPPSSRRAEIHALPPLDQPLPAPQAAAVGVGGADPGLVAAGRWARAANAVDHKDGILPPTI